MAAPQGANADSTRKTLTPTLVANGSHTIFVNPVGAYVGNMTRAVR